MGQISYQQLNEDFAEDPCCKTPLTLAGWKATCSTAAAAPGSGARPMRCSAARPLALTGFPVVPAPLLMPAGMGSSYQGRPPRPMPAGAVVMLTSSSRCRSNQNAMAFRCPASTTCQLRHSDIVHWYDHDAGQRHHAAGAVITSRLRMFSRPRPLRRPSKKYSNTFAGRVSTRWGRSAR